MNFRIYIFLFIFCNFADFVIADDFVELKPIVLEGKVDLGKTMKGKEYFFQLQLEGVKGHEIVKATTSCACLEILEYSKDKSEKNFKISLLYIPVKNGVFKTTLDFQLSDNSKKTFAIISKVLGDEKNTVQLGLENRLLTRELKSYNKKLYVDVAKALESSQKVLYVDVRSRAQYSKLRIPKSLNLRPNDLISSPYFSSKVVILVNEGFYSSWLESECLKLRSRGLKSVFILQGGINAWSQNQKLDGLGKAKLEQGISFAQFFDIKNFSNVKFVYTSENAQKIRGVLPYAIHVSEASKLEKSKNDLWIYLDQLKPMSKGSFYLKGSIEEFQKFLTEQSKLLLGGKIKTTRKGCPGCPK